MVFQPQLNNSYRNNKVMSMLSPILVFATNNIRRTISAPKVTQIKGNGHEVTPVLFSQSHPKFED